MIARHLLIALAIALTPFVAGAAEASSIANGMFALTSNIVPGGTCTPEQQLQPFNFFYYPSALNPGSEFYLLGTPGQTSDTVILPASPPDGQEHWHGKMTWTKNPFTGQGPWFRTAFSLKLIYVESRLIYINGTFEVPIATGGTCTEKVNYTGTRTGP